MTTDFPSNALLDSHYDAPGFLKYLGVSIGCHLLLLLTFSIGNIFGLHKRPAAAQFITVDLVTLPEAASPTRPKASRQTASTAPEKSKQKAAVYQKPKNMVPMAEVPAEKKVKTSLKQKTFDADKILNETLNRLQQQVAAEPPAPLAQAIDQLNKKVANSENNINIAANTKNPGTARKGAVEAIDIYKLEIQYRILGNWVFPRQADRKNKDMKTIIAIKIAADGQIVSMWFDQRSGNDYHDESARKAILKSAPLPPLPPGYPVYTVGLEFTPSAQP